MDAQKTIKQLLRNSERMEDQLAVIQLHLKAKRQSPWLDAVEAAAYCGYGRSSFYNKYKNEIPHHQRDTKIMFHVDDLEKWMQKNKKAPAVTGAHS